MKEAFKMSGKVNGYMFPSPLAACDFSQGGTGQVRSGQYFVPIPPPWPNRDRSWPAHPARMQAAMPEMVQRPQFNHRMNAYDQRFNFRPYKSSICRQFQSECPKYNGTHGGASSKRLMHKSAKEIAHKNANNLVVDSCAFFCEPCEKEFKTEQDKMAHVKQHVKCEVEGCGFVASRKTIKLHFIQLHEVGKFRIVLKNEEDIKNWREERRKNFPSLQRKKEKLEEKKIKVIQGNILKKTQFSYKGEGSWQRRTLIATQQENGTNKNNVMECSLENDFQSNATNKIECKEENEKLNDMEGLNGKGYSMQSSSLASLRLLYDSSSSESEDNADVHSKVSECKQAMLNVTDSNSVAKKEDFDNCEYNKTSTANCHQKGSDGNENKCDYVKNNSKSETTNNLEKKIERNQYIASNLDDKNKRIDFSNDKKRKSVDKGKVTTHNIKRKRVRPTLLEMLLANDIKHERNIILQCIRYINKNAFFKND